MPIYWPSGGGGIGPTGPTGPAGPTGPQGVPGSVTNAGTLTTDQPVFGNGTVVVKVGTKHGSTLDLATVSGAITPGHIVTVDASGNLVDGGAPSGGGGALVLLEQHTASNSASLDFTTAISATYDTYKIEFVAVVPATNAMDFWMRVNTGGGFISTGIYSYINLRFTDTAVVPAGDVSGAATQIFLCGEVDHISSSANWGISGEATLFTYPGTFTKIAAGPFAYIAGSGGYLSSMTTGIYNATTAITQIRFLFSSGNIASGTIRVYGISKT